MREPVLSCIHQTGQPHNTTLHSPLNRSCQTRSYRLVISADIAAHNSASFSTQSSNALTTSQQHPCTQSSNITSIITATSSHTTWHHSSTQPRQQCSQPVVLLIQHHSHLTSGTLTDSRSPYHPRKALAYARAAVVGGCFLWYHI